MTDEIREMLKKAERSLLAAQALLDSGDSDFSVSRAYYGMFYVAEAALQSKGLAYSKHSGVMSGFSQHFIKPHVFEAKCYDMFRFAFEQRNLGDYRFGKPISREVAEKVLREAKEFVGTVSEYLRRSP